VGWPRGGANCRDIGRAVALFGLDQPDTTVERRLILMDRDGTVIVERDYLSDPDGVELIPDAAEALIRLKAAGHKLALVSNQSGIARGFYTLDDLAAVDRRLQDMLADAGLALDSVQYCPHGPEDGCRCRKPGTGMLETASQETGLPLSNAVMIGDKAADIEAGRRAGAETFLVRTGYGRETERRGDASPDHIVDDLPAAVDFILGMPSDDR